MTTRVRILNEGPAVVYVKVINPALFSRDGSPHEVRPRTIIDPYRWHDEYLHSMQSLAIEEGNLPSA